MPHHEITVVIGRRFNAWDREFYSNISTAVWKGYPNGPVLLLTDPEPSRTKMRVAEMCALALIGSKVRWVYWMDEGE
jgi:hypothetical protein